MNQKARLTILLVRLRKRLFFSRARFSHKLPREYRPRVGIIHRIRRLGLLTKLLLLFGLMVLVTSVWLFSSQSPFIVTSVLVDFTPQSEQTQIPTAIESLNQTFLGKNILLLESGEVLRVLEGEFPAILAVRLSRILPATVKVEISMRTPVLRLYGKGGDEEYLVDANGVVFALARGEVLPRVEIGSNLAIGDHLSNTQLGFLLSLLGKMNEEKVTKVEFLSEWDVGLEFDHLRILFSIAKPLEQQLWDLNEVTQHYKMKNVTLSKVDLRPERPVVSIVP